MQRMQRLFSHVLENAVDNCLNTFSFIRNFHHMSYHLFHFMKMELGKTFVFSTKGKFGGNVLMWWGKLENGRECCHENRGHFP
jgi:hypothetical protein